MATTEKPSVSGLMSEPHEVGRFKNLFYLQFGNAYYNQEWGLDWDTWLSRKYELPINSFFSYLTQEAVKKAIIVTHISGGIVDFTLEMTVKIDGVNILFNEDVNNVLIR